MHLLKALSLSLLTFKLASTAPLLGPPRPPPPSGGNDTDNEKACLELMEEMAQQLEGLALAAQSAALEQVCLITNLSSLEDISYCQGICFFFFLFCNADFLCLSA